MSKSKRDRRLDETIQGERGGSAFLRGGYYLCRVRHNGKAYYRRVEPVPGEEYADTARKTLRALADEVKHGVVDASGKTFADGLDLVRDFLKAKHGERTRAAEERRLARIVERFGSVPLAAITPGAVESFLVGLTDERTKATGDGPRKLLGAAGRNRYAALLSVAFKVFKKHKWVTANPVREVERDREEVPPVPFVSSADVDRIVAAANPEDGFRTFVRVLADSGLRRSEALALEWRDVDLRRRVLLVRKSKAKDSREVPMLAAVHAALSALPRDAAPLDQSKARDLVFPALAALDPSSVSGRFERAARRAGFAKATRLRLHDMRHGLGSRLAQAGVPIVTIAAILGHKCLKTTERYARHLPETATKAAMRALEAAQASAAADDSREGHGRGYAAASSS